MSAPRIDASGTASALCKGESGGGEPSPGWKWRSRLARWLSRGAKQPRRRRPHVERLELRRVLAADWRNSVDSLDVDRDQFIAPLDALLVINELNGPGSGPLPTVKPDSAPFLDSNGDQFLSPVDALLVINYLNEGEGPQRRLQEGESLVRETSVTIGLGQSAGTRTYRAQIDASFDTTDGAAAVEDLLAVYLVDPNSPSVTLLDRGEPGTALFTLAGDRAEYAAGRVRWDGRYLEIDTGDLATRDTGLLRFQLLGGDDDRGTRVTILPLSNEVDLETVPGPRFAADPALPVATTAQNLASLAVIASAEFQVGNVRFDDVTGRYRAALQVHAPDVELGGQAIVSFPSLPAGVTLVDAAGVDGQGAPYLNVATAIPAGGLAAGEWSRAIELELSDPSQTLFVLRPRLSAAANHAPTLAPLGPLTVAPGGALSVTLDAQDVDGDALQFSLRSTTALPTGSIRPDGTLEFHPSPAQVGEYQFEVLVSDGRHTTSRLVNLSVVPDANTATRISGRLLRTDEFPLAGVVIEVGGVQTLTQADGSFQLDLGAGPVVAETLKVRGETLVGPVGYPFLAEKLRLLLEHDVFAHVDNVIGRPIYLPALDVAHGAVIDPLHDVLVDTSTLPEATVLVRAGTLMNLQGTPFTGTLSITEVPVAQTPVALPVQLRPDLVVTIQPGEMVFASPAPMTLPNRAHALPGTAMDLWSINPVTGDFEDVGDMQVSADGLRLETIAGGIRNSSWHFAVPVTQTPVDETRSTQCVPACSLPAQPAMEVDSGANLVEYALPGYESFGESRAWTLTYDSLRASPGAVVQFSHEVARQVAIGNPTQASPRMFATLNIEHQGIVETLPGAMLPGETTPSNLHFWDATGLNDGDIVGGALFTGLPHVPTGFVNYALDTGFGLLSNDGRLTGRSAPLRGEVLHVNSRDGEFGGGWGLAGLQRLIVKADEGGSSPLGSVLLVDGDGSESLFLAEAGGEFASPRGDFSRLERLVGGDYRRTLPDTSFTQFDSQGKLTSSVDRRGQATTFEYDGAGRLLRIVDPAGLATTFAYVLGRLGQVTLPDGRATTFEIDSDGDLIRIVAPDGSERRFGYDGEHRLTSETDARGAVRFNEYDEYGRLRRTMAADGAEQRFAPQETASLYLGTATASATAPPAVRHGSTRTTRTVSSNGDVVEYSLDRFGAIVAVRDSLGPLVSLERDERGLVVESSGARGQRTRYEYDALGGVTRIEESLALGGNAAAPQYPGRNYLDVTPSPVDSASGDFNSDGYPDLVVIGAQSPEVVVMLNDGTGSFLAPVSIATSRSGGARVEAADVDQDGLADVIGAFNGAGGEIVVLRGDGQGGFAAPLRSSVGAVIQAIAVADFNGDGFVDVAAARQNGVVVMAGDGQGHFAAATTLAISGPAFALSAADVDSDGRADLIALLVNLNVVRSWRGDGGGGFSAATDVGYVGTALGQRGAMLVTDVSGDGAPDVAVLTSQLQLFAGDGVGGFAPWRTVPLPSPEKNVVAGDFNGDGEVDFLIGAQHGAILAGDGAGNFSAGSTFFVNEANTDHSLRVDDLNLDGRPDPHVTNVGSRSLSVFQSTVDGALQAPRSLPAGGTSPRGVALADFDEDGALDMAITVHGANAAGILRGDGDGGFSSPTLFSIQDAGRGIASTGPSVAATADFDRDGHADLIVGNGVPGSADFTYFRGDGDGTLTLVDRFALGAGVHALAVGDFNGDDWPDLAVGTNRIGDSLELFLGGPGGFNLPAIVLPTESLVNDLAVADLNGDGRLDLVSAISFHDLVVWRNQGANSFTPLALSQFGNTTVVETGDLNGDGRPDILAVRSNGAASFLTQQDGSFQFRSLGAFGVIQTHPETLELADLDDDGRLDLIVGDPFLTALAVVHGTGDGGFERATLLPMAGQGLFATAVGDVNGDQRPDLVATHPNTANVSVSASELPALATLVREFTYDGTFHQLTSVRDERGFLTTFDLDPVDGDRLATHLPDGSVALQTFAPSGQLATRADALGRLTTFQHDAAGRVIRYVVAAGTPDELVVRYEYDAGSAAGRAGRVTAMIVENSTGEQRTTFEYDALLRLIAATEPDPDGIGPLAAPVTTYAYDVAGNRTSMTDPLGRLTTYVYDARNRLVRSVSPDPDGAGSLAASVQTWTYDRAGDLIESTDALGDVVRRRYDLRHRLVETIDPDGGRSTTRYDLDGNPIVLIDPLGNVTRQAFDARSRLTSAVDPLLSSSRWSYDGADHLVRSVARDRRVVSYEYDARGWLVRETWDEGNNSFEYTYDAVGNRLSASDADNRLTFTYDARDRLVGATVDGPLDAPSFALVYSYDAAGNLLSTTDAIVSGTPTVTASTYDALNRLASRSQSGPAIAAKRVDLAYDVSGATTSIVRFADLAATAPVAQSEFAYDGQGRLVNLVHRTSGVAPTTIASHDYVYDADSRIVRQVGVDGETDYAYDRRDQLTSAAHGDARRPDETYAYDADGNRTASSLHGVAYETGPADRVATDGVFDYVYDAEGNLVRRSDLATGASRLFVWDFRDRLTSVVDLDAQQLEVRRTTYFYDPLDRRVAQVDESVADGARATYFLNDGRQVLADYEDVDGPAGAAPPALSRRYLFGDRVDQLFAQEDATGNVLWPLADQLGTIADVIDSQAALVDHVVRDSYGNVVTETGPGTTRFGFTGREFDEATGLYYYRARYYDSALGRFLSPDPLGLASGDANFYRYVGNDPVRLVDPFGRNAMDAAAIASQQVVATLYSAEGTVEVSSRRAPGEGVWFPATVGMSFYPGDRLRTGPSSRAGVRFTDGTLARLNENSWLSFLTDEELERNRQPESGSDYFFSREPKGYPTCSTPTISTGVRG